MSAGGEVRRHYVGFRALSHVIQRRAGRRRARPVRGRHDVPLSSSTGPCLGRGSLRVGPGRCPASNSASMNAAAAAPG